MWKPKPKTLQLELHRIYKHYGQIKPKRIKDALRVAAAHWKEILYVLTRLSFLIDRGEENPRNFYKYMKYIPWKCEDCPASELESCPIYEANTGMCLKGIHLLWLYMSSHNLAFGLREAQTVPAQFEESALLAAEKETS